MAYKKSAFIVPDICQLKKNLRFEFFFNFKEQIKEQVRTQQNMIHNGKILQTCVKFNLKTI